MANVDLTEVAVSTPVEADHVVGVTAGGLLKRFLVSAFVRAARTINGHPLTADVVVTAADVGAPSGSGTSTGTNTGDQNLNAAITYTGGPGVAWRMRGTDFSAEVPNFNIGGASFAGVNLPASALQNTVMSAGWNVAANGAREDISKAALRFAMEENYHQAGAGPAAQELHLESIDLSGVAHRFFTAFLQKNGAGGVGAIEFDVLVFGRYDGLDKLQWNLLTGTVDFSSGFLQRFMGNNVPAIQQRNAANNAFLDYPYFGSDNRLISSAPISYAGPTPTSGTYANVFAAYQPTTLAANGLILYVQAPAVTGTTNLGRFAGNSTADSVFSIYNDANNLTSNVAIELRTIGAGGGDCITRRNVNGATQWTEGLDNSDSDKYKWGTAALGSADKMTLTTNGDLTLSGSVRTASYTVATLPSASGLGAGTMIYVSNASGSPCLAFSDATNWKRCDAASTTVT